jgi:hypothetical protein
MGNFDRGVDVLWAVDGGSGGPDLAQANRSAATTHRGGGRFRVSAAATARARGEATRAALGRELSWAARAGGNRAAARVGRCWARMAGCG